MPEHRKRKKNRHTLNNQLKQQQGHAKKNSRYKIIKIGMFFAR